MQDPHTLVPPAVQLEFGMFNRTRAREELSFSQASFISAPPEIQYALGKQALFGWPDKGSLDIGDGQAEDTRIRYPRATGDLRMRRRSWPACACLLQKHQLHYARID